MFTVESIYPPSLIINDEVHSIPNYDVCVRYTPKDYNIKKKKLTFSIVL